MKITTVIPTLCQVERRDALLRAIKSIHAASVEAIRVVIVVNGQRFDKDLLQVLRLRDDVEVIQIEEGSLIKAHLAGRAAIRSEYFSFLDDDDEYLPGALDVRLKAIENSPDVDVVVTNGYLHSEGEDRILYSRLSHVVKSPMVELFNENWLHNCNHLFRSSRVGKEFFEDAHAYMEWTWLAFRLASGGRVVGAIDIPTFRYWNTPGSLSKSSNFLRSRINLYHRMLATRPERKVDGIIRARLSSAWHDLSVFELGAGNRGKAITAHLKSMTSDLSGLRYLSYSRRLL